MLFKLIRFLRHQYQRRTAKPVFYGVYSGFSEVQDQNPWKSEPWISGNISKLNNIKEGHFLLHRLNHDGIADQSHILIPALLLNTLSHKRNINILDFGGGTGFTYFAMKDYLSNSSNVSWKVFDPNDDLYSVGMKYVEQRAARGLVDNVQFLNDLPEGAIDVVHSASTIQYIDDYEGLLLFLLDKYQPTHFLVTRLVGGDIDEFVTRQDISGFSTPCRFNNVNNLISVFEKRNYSVLYNGPCGGFESGQFSPEIPKEQQIRRGVDLVFVRD
jgi:putative methyltransferase (TIGR04325 family)